jgi:hypothetical protein
VIENSSQSPVKKNSDKASWVPMEMEYLGNAAQLVQGGGGKLTTNAGDPGETRKQQPTG